ncbi:PepSY domain-containing protein [Heyndrickxia oleronia]|jgi:predicted small secreted protein|uniref:PepSY domain-containing protein n=1 Tax=Heyndrickxia oleronia TaxID=38875 RepID=A0AAW6T0H8_9BACI|nr:PepSY domain-containing protein [Heyndrickxia oleronia]MDH5164008.1 PepSY domain-containing protein [Heyndrickxia oleronia]
MNLKSFVTGIAIGAVSGYLVNEVVKSKTFISSDTVLANVKKAFKESTDVEGSWIQQMKEDYEKFPIKAKIYRGGVTCRINDKRVQYEFIADAYTGTVLDVYPI